MLMRRSAPLLGRWVSSKLGFRLTSPQNFHLRNRTRKRFVHHLRYYSFDFVIILYIFNLILVFVDIVLYLKYSRRIAPPPATLD